MNNRQIRQLRKSKGQRTKPTRGRSISPHASEGATGEVQIRQTQSGPKLFVKSGEKWYTTDVIEVRTSTKISKANKPDAPL